MSAEILALAERCEQAMGPSRALDRDIARAVLGPEINSISAMEYAFCRNYSDSLDAAMTLIPAGRGWLVGFGRTRPDEPVGGAQITASAYDFLKSGDIIAEAEAATPALALCAAALRTRALAAQDQPQ